MLAASDFPLEHAERLFAPLGISPAYFAPTQTGLEKSITDATDGVRELLKREGIHDFDSQKKGQKSKVVVDIQVFHKPTHTRTKISFYRPETKNGDPRMWISRLGSMVSVGNLIALLVVHGELIALVISNQNVRDALMDENSELRQMLAASAPANVASAVSDTLVAELRKISAHGWHDAVRTGDTAVGMTLESCLGIAPNSSCAPDYHGFELKAKVLKTGVAKPEDAKTRQTLFACVPDWDISRLKGSKHILAQYGYPDKKGRARRRLYCEVTSRKENSQGLKFEIDHTCGQLVEVHVNSSTNNDVVRWRRASLEDKLNRKHAQTAWVYARERDVQGTRQFRYFQTTITAAPRSASFLNLIETGIISMDHLIKEDLKGQVSEKGPLFKINAKDFALLFPFRRSEILTA